MNRKYVAKGNNCCHREGLSGVRKLLSEDLIVARQKVAWCRAEFINVCGLMIGMGRDVEWRNTTPKGDIVGKRINAFPQ
jgi:hypothetical protein